MNNVNNKLTLVLSHYINQQTNNLSTFHLGALPPSDYSNKSFSISFSFTFCFFISTNNSSENFL